MLKRLRRPDNVVWHWPKSRLRCFVIGWDVQKYGFGAKCTSIFLGLVTLRWHTR